VNKGNRTENAAYPSYPSDWEMQLIFPIRTVKVPIERGGVILAGKPLNFRCGRQRNNDKLIVYLVDKQEKI